jgi:hypothetical protein
MTELELFNLVGACIATGVAGVHILNKRKFIGRQWTVVMGHVNCKGHGWMETDDGLPLLMIDLTSDQFGFECPFFGVERDPRYSLSESILQGALASAMGWVSPMEAALTTKIFSHAPLRDFYLLPRVP